MGNPVYAIDEFPDDDLLWRVEWIGGLGYNTSEPRIDVCLAQLPFGETNPLSARSRSSQTKRTVKIGVGLLPYVSIASVWQKRRPVDHLIELEGNGAKMGLVIVSLQLFQAGKSAWS